MWYLERNSIYTDLRLKTVFYGRFYDDIGSVGDRKRRAQIMFNSIETHDPDKLIKKEDFSAAMESRALECFGNLKRNF